MSFMEAARFHGARDIRIEEVNFPTPAAGEALVAVEWCGLCGSDLTEYLHGPRAIPTQAHPLSGEKMPITMGHEFTGRVLQAPPHSTLAPGQAVTVDPRLYCTGCSPCLKRLTNGCEKWGFLGLSGGGGGLSKAVTVDVQKLHVLPDEVDLSIAALLEPLAVAWHAVKLSEITDWDGQSSVSILIVGGGPIGVGMIYALRAWGAKHVFVSEVSPKRRRFLRGIADAVLNPLEVDIPTECHRLSNGQGVAVVFDCAGSQQGMDSAMAGLCFRGRYINVAIPGQQLVLPIGPMLLKEITMRSSFAYDDMDFQETVAAFLAGKLEGIENMITRRISLKDVVQHGFEELVNNRDENIKIMVRPEG